MKQQYIADYSQNFNDNMNEKQANISGFIDAIKTKKTDLSKLQDVKDQNKAKMLKFFEKRNKTFYWRVCMKHWLTYWKNKKEKKRIWAYRRNTLYRAKLCRIFKGMFAVQHEKGRKRILEETKEHREKLEM